MTLRDYQTRTIRLCREAYRDGKRSILIVLPTGAGKTRLMSALVASVVARGGHVLWIVHRKELIKQAAQALQDVGLVVGILAPWATYRRGCQVTVASIQTLIARDALPECDVMVWDEAHHAVSETYSKVAEHYAGVLRFGLTATPQRDDGVGLGAIYDAMVVGATPAELTAAGWLVPCRVFGVTAKTKSLAAHPVEAYRKWAMGRPTAVFCESVSHARDLAREFVFAGFRAACIDGEVDTDARDAILADYRAGKIKILTNVQVLTEGWDAPETSCAILARNVGTESTYLQIVGRTLRPAEGKTDALILDLRGSAIEHGMPTDDRVYTFDGAGIKCAEHLPPCTRCKACGMVFRAAEWRYSNDDRNPTCPGCGTPKPLKLHPSVRQRIIQAIAAKDPDVSRTEFLRKHVMRCRANGIKVGQAGILFKKRYGYWPSSAICAAAGYWERAS